MPTENPYRNWFLASCAPEERRILGPLEHITVKTGEVIVEAGTRPRFFWFAERGFISVGRPLLDGRTVEVGYIGRHGVMPVQGVLSQGQSCDLNFIAQQPGELLRMPLALMRMAVERNPAIQRRFFAAARAAFAMLAITSACNRHHSDAQRVVRRLLTMSEDTATVAITHEFLGQMLGISRPNTGRVTAKLAQAGLIRRGYGKITITDRAGLARRSCECFGQISQLLAQLK